LSLAPSPILAGASDRRGGADDGRLRPRIAFFGQVWERCVAGNHHDATLLSDHAGVDPGERCGSRETGDSPPQPSPSGGREREGEAGARRDSEPVTRPCVYFRGSTSRHRFKARSAGVDGRVSLSMARRHCSGGRGLSLCIVEALARHLSSGRLLVSVSALGLSPLWFVERNTRVKLHSALPDVEAIARSGTCSVFSLSLGRSDAYFPIPPTCTVPAVRVVCIFLPPAPHSVTGGLLTHMTISPAALSRFASFASASAQRRLELGTRPYSPGCGEDRPGLCARNTARRHPLC